jgi:DNA helicase-2/ATP-dependent DNA helicase PcrA
MPWVIAQALVQPERRADALRNLDGLRRLAAGYASTALFFDHLNQTALKRAGQGDGLLALHAGAAAVKGLEFEEVLLPFLEQGEFPDRRGRLEDEANLFYVAITRARANLRLYLHARRPSIFVARAGLDLDVET